jgi:hypothetical protein
MRPTNWTKEVPNVKLLESVFLIMKNYKGRRPLSGEF